MAKINVKLIMELLNSGMSRNQIAATRHIGRHSVDDVKRIAAEKNIVFDDLKDMTYEDAYRLFFPDRNQLENLYERANYDYVHAELKKTGVTLKLLWEEYKDSCSKKNKIPMGYTKYCRGYGDFVLNNSFIDRRCKNTF